MLVLVPVSWAELAAWASGSVVEPAVAYAGTPTLREAFGLRPEADEEAERTALHVAALAALLRAGRRLVAVADVPARDLAGPWGEVAVGSLAHASVTALFADDPAGDAVAADAARSMAGAELADAWDHPAHEALLRSADLLWHGPQEWVLLAPKP